MESAAQKAAAPLVQKQAPIPTQVVKATPTAALMQTARLQQNMLIDRKDCIQPPHGFAPLPEGGRIAANECQ